MSTRAPADSTSVAVSSDFSGDLHALLRKLLAGEGFTVSQTGTLEEQLRQWLHVQHRRVAKKPRAVAWSAELRAREPSLPADEREALRRIESAVESGEDLNPYLSRQLRTDKAFKKHDGMLNELGVQHMHLGSGLDEKGMVVGTDNLLFVIVGDDTVRFLEIFDHRSFGDERPFHIAQSNWPALFRRINIPTPRAPASPLTSEQRATLRRKGVNAIVTTPDGSAFFPPGGGIASSGISVNVVEAADEVLDRLARCETWCGTHGEILAARVVDQGGEKPAALRLRFVEFDSMGAALVVDDASGACFRLES